MEPACAHCSATDGVLEHGELQLHLKPNHEFKKVKA